MKDLVLIDTSVWVEATRRGGDQELRAAVGDLLRVGRVAMTDPVWVELYQGIRGKREEGELSDLRSLCEWLEFDESCWQRAAESGRACLRSGVNVPFGDLLIHACAQRYEIHLLERDRHFAMIESVRPDP